MVKNKVAPPFRQAEFDLMHDRGISREGDLLDLAIEDKIDRRRAAPGLSYGERPLGQGRENAKQYLRDNPALVEEISRKVLEKRGLLAGPAGGPDADAEDDETIPEQPVKETKRGRGAAAAAEEA